MARTAAPAHGGRRQEEALAPYEGQARRAPTEHPGREGGIAEAKNTQRAAPRAQEPLPYRHDNTIGAMKSTQPTSSVTRRFLSACTATYSRISALGQ